MRERTRVGPGPPKLRVLPGPETRLVFGRHIWCRYCKGKGKREIEGHKNAKCPNCAGRGYIDTQVIPEDEGGDDPWSEP